MTKFTVPDMTCGHCASVITKAVKGIDPAADVQVDLSNKAVLVTSSTELSRISEAIRDAGYSNTAG